MDAIALGNLITQVGPALGTVLAITYFGSLVFKWTAEKVILPLVDSIKYDAGKKIDDLREEFEEFRREALSNQAAMLQMKLTEMSLIRDLAHQLGKETKPLDEITKQMPGVAKP